MRDEPDQSANRLIWFGVQGSPPRSPRLWVYSALVLDMLAFYVYGVCVYLQMLYGRVCKFYSGQAGGIKGQSGLHVKNE